MVLAYVLALCLAAAPRPDVVVADFEGEDYAGWVATGTAFGDRPAAGTLPGQMDVSGFVGRGLVNSYRGGDEPTGTLTSPPFRLERAYLNFLVGGGKDERRLSMELLVDGRVVRQVTGPNAAPGGTERLRPSGWDVQPWRGQLATLRITDQASGGWGHINIDHVVLSDRKVSVPMAKNQVLTVTGRYLHLPVRGGAERVAMVIPATATKPDDRFTIELATDGNVEWWAPTDLGDPAPARIEISADAVPDDLDLAKLVRFADDFIGAEDMYREALRPQFHFTTKRGWINDPNGLVWQDGEWHLFYQHTPWAWGGAEKYWGHAVSTDLLHWRELAEALYPDPSGAMWSGSAVIDEQRTSGLGDGAEPPLITIYTAAGDPFTQAIAYSSDRGRTLTKWTGNPVLPHIIGGNRDPKVLWYEPERKWIMALYLDREDFALFESKDLKSWTKIDDVHVQGCSECPEFFPIAVEGSPDEVHWVFYGGNGRYLIGQFDGREFTPQSGPFDFHHGNCWYASQTFTGVPESDGRRIQIGWGTVDLPGMPFNQQMAFPCELTLRRTPDGLRLLTAPIREVATLYRATTELPTGPMVDGRRALPEVRGGLYDIEVELEPGAAQSVGLDLRGFPVRYDVAAGQLTVNDVTDAAPLHDGRLRLRILVDRASIEVWVNDGEVYMPVRAVAGPERDEVALTATGAGARLVSGVVRELASVWE